MKFDKLLLLSLVFSILLSILVVPGVQNALAEDIREPEDLVLEAAEEFFISLKENNYGNAWSLLSQRSREMIINDVRRASAGEINREEIKKDFESNGIMFMNYWDAFLKNFDPDMVLEQSRWEIGKVKKGVTEIIITYIKSNKTTSLRILKEGEDWKVGLVESFWDKNL
jgi:hypothetical protein